MCALFSTWILYSHVQSKISLTIMSLTFAEEYLLYYTVSIYGRCGVASMNVLREPAGVTDGCFTDSPNFYNTERALVLARANVLTTVLWVS